MKHQNTKAAFFLKAKKSLGQNFITNTTVIDDIVHAAENILTAHKIQTAQILEIGPGTGMLSKGLLENSNRPRDIITAVEKDHRAIKGLQKNLIPEYPNRFVLEDADILLYQPSKFDLCIGNIPYYITSDILMWLTKNKTHFLNAILMVQDEVADRLCAEHNTKEYSRLTVKMQLNFEIKKLFQVSKDCFTPRPKVNSAVIQLTPKPFAFEDLKVEKDFEAFTTRLFSQRRKMLRRILGDTLKTWNDEKESVFWSELQSLHIIPSNRPENISPANILEFFKIYQKFVE